MATAGIKAAAYCLNFAPELALHYGGTPAQERKSKPDSEFLRALPEHAQAYAPNKTYIGAMSIDELEKAPAPWIDNLGTPERFGSFGEIMPEDEFLGLMDICDVFDLIWLEEGFAASVAEKLAQNPVIGEKQLARLEKGRPESDILDVVEKQHALPLYSEGRLAGCCRRAHDLTVLRLASRRTVSDLFYFHSDTSVVIKAVLRFFVGTLGFPTVIFILNCTFDALLKLCIKLFKLLQAVGTDIDKHGTFICDGIDRGSAVYDTDGEGSLRFSRGAELGDIGDSTPHGKDRIDKTEGTEGMSTRSAEGYLVAVASGAAVADQTACSINGDKTVNLVGIL